MAAGHVQVKEMALTYFCGWKMAMVMMMMMKRKKEERKCERRKQKVISVRCRLANTPSDEVVATS